jgi:anti-sigma B factor antagonist
MKIDEATSGAVLVVRLAGDLDMKEAGVLQTRLAERIAKGQARIVVNLAGVAYIDSAGLGALVATLKACTGQGGRLVLAAPGADVRHILTITRVDRHLPIHPTESDAVAAAQQ